jgi:predicted RNA-binding protein YlxR (DUF448 family)
MNAYEFALSKVQNLLSKLVAVLAVGRIPSDSEVAFFDAACDQLFSMRMAPNHALRIKCLGVLKDIEGAKKSREAFLSQRATALAKAADKQAASRALWAAGEAEADARAKAAKEAKVKLVKVAKGSWRKSDFADIEAAMLAPRVEAE